MSTTIDLSKLSRREREVMDMAAEGATDIQIAQMLDISVGTVNSYWVRIRGKLGHSSRTELVAQLLRSSSETELKAVREKASELERELEFKNYLTQSLTFEEKVYRWAFQAVPLAMMVLDEQGTVLVANEAAGRIWDRDSNAMVGASFTSLFPVRRQRMMLDALAELVRSPGEHTIGLRTVCYIMAEKGDLRRVLIHLKSERLPNGIQVICVVRDMHAEIEAMRLRASVVTEELTTQRSDTAPAARPRPRAFTVRRWQFHARDSGLGGEPPETVT